MAAPVRMCRVCRQRLSKTELHRWVLQQGQLVADHDHKLPGRGFYACSPEHDAILPKVIKR